VTIEQVPNLPQIAALIRATPETIRSEVKALGLEAARWHPAPDEWCANEVIGHLIEADRHGFHGRIETILKEAQPELQTWDITGIATKRRDCERDPFDLLDELAAMREKSAGLVTGLWSDQLTRSGIHPLVGELRVIDLIHEWIHHDQNHIKQISNNIQAYVWPNMGNAQNFGKVY
jgi:hypothetical protein